MLIVKETGPFAADQVANLLRRLAYQVGRTAKSPHENDVHDLRVAIRRFTQALASFDSCIPAKEAKKIRRRSKKIMALAGDVRDCDIALGLLSKSKVAPVALLSSFRKRRKEAERDLTVALKGWLERHAYSEWRTALENGGRGGARYDPIEVTAARSLQPMLQEFLSRGKQAVRPKAALEKIHQFRILAKKLRYTLELFAPVYGASFDGWIEQVKALQNVLGVISDCETVRVMVRREGGNRRIAASLRRRASKKLLEFGELWDNSFSDSSIQGLIYQIKQAVPGTPAADRMPAVPETSQRHAAYA